MTLGAVAYVASYFKYKNPTPFYGTPTNKPLKLLKAKLRANTSSMEAHLGRGDYGYLGLALTDVEYTRITTHSPRLMHLTIPFLFTFHQGQAKLIPSPSDTCTMSRHANTTSARMLRRHYNGIFKMLLRTNTWRHS